MQTIQPIRMEDAGRPTRRLLESLDVEHGHIPNMFQTMAQSPGVLEGYLAFVSALETGLNPVLSEQIALNVAQAEECDYTLAFHTARARKLGLDESAILASREGRAADKKTSAALRFARNIATHNGEYGVTELREAGCSDADIVNIIAWVGLTSFADLFNTVVKTEMDARRSNSSKAA